MKDLFFDANFPRTADQRVYHLGLRVGEVANRIVTVGSPSRANAIATLFDEYPRVFKLTSERGFMTITGRYKGVPISIVSIGMGGPNMDFFVREVRECLTGDMVVIRLGSCGGLAGLSVGSLVVPTASVAVTRNLDFDFVNNESSADPYRISKPAPADSGLHAHLVNVSKSFSPPNFNVPIHSDAVNASADSFYSSQGRLTSFIDRNESLIDRILATVPNASSLEMETFYLLHLAACWRPQSPAGDDVKDKAPPPTHLPVSPPSIEPFSQQPSQRREVSEKIVVKNSRIKAAAIQMIFASRTSQEFINPERVVELEAWSGKVVLEALATFSISPEMLHDEAGSVWEQKQKSQ